MQVRALVYVPIVALLLVGCGDGANPAVQSPIHANSETRPATKAATTGQARHVAASKPLAKGTADAASSSAASTIGDKGPISRSDAPLPFCSSEFFAVLNIRIAKLFVAPRAKALSPIFVDPSEEFLENFASPAFRFRPRIQGFIGGAHLVEHAEEIWIYADPQPVGVFPCGPVVVLRMVDANAADAIMQDPAAAGTEKGEEAGQEFLLSETPEETQVGKWGMWRADDRTVVGGPANLVRRAIRGGRDAQSPLADFASRAKVDGHINVLSLSGKAQPLMLQAEKFLAAMRLPPPYDVLSKLPSSLKSAAVSVSLDGRDFLSIVATANDEAEGRRLETALGDVWNSWATLLQAAAEKQPAEWKSKAVGLAAELSEGVALARDSETVHWRLAAPKSLETAARHIIGPGTEEVQAARRLERRRFEFGEIASEVQRIQDPLSTYRDVYSTEGKPLLSWRVKWCIKQYGFREDKDVDLKEPWDGPKNKKLLALIPEIFQAPGAPKGYTSVFTFKGPTTAFPGPGPLTDEAFKDRRDETLFLVVAKSEHAVPWTKPSDIDFDPEKAVESVLLLPEKNVLAALFSGRAIVFAERPTADALKALVEIADGKKAEVPE